MEDLEAGDSHDDALGGSPTVSRERAIGPLERARAQLAAGDVH